MARTKLILICQSGGEFVIKDDGSMSYTGGEAHAVDINLETVFDDLKFELAEMLNLEYKSISMKYFLPGNTQTLITLSNDKDLKRMYEFHGNSGTADVFVMGKAGFDSEALSTHRSACGITMAEYVTPVAAYTTSAAALHAIPLAIYSPTAPTDAKSAVGSAAANAIPVVPAPLPLSKQAGFVMFVGGRAQSPSILACGIKLAESVAPVAASTTSAAALHASPLTAPTDAKSAVGSAAANTIPVVHAPLHLSKQAGSAMSVEGRAQSPSGVDATSSIPSDPVSVTADASVHSLNQLDMNATPADTVKKRRRSATWKIGADGPTIVAVTDHVREKRKVMARKKNIRSTETDDVFQKQGILPCEDSSTSSDPIQDT